MDVYTHAECQRSFQLQALQRFPHIVFLYSFSFFSSVLSLYSLSPRSTLISLALSLPLPCPPLPLPLHRCNAFLLAARRGGGRRVRGPGARAHHQVVSNPIFRNTPIFLFLNKKDIFETMVEKTPLTACFPDFPGPEKDVHAALKFLEEQYAKVCC